MSRAINIGPIHLDAEANFYQRGGTPPVKTKP